MIPAGAEINGLGMAKAKARITIQRSI